jgi:hypothetical protein
MEQAQKRSRTLTAANYGPPKSDLELEEKK